MEQKDVENFLSGANYRHVKNHRNRLKEKLVEYKGGKCEICGYDKCIEALEFHHLNPEEKDFSISSYSTLSFENLKKEVDKCILVCANCHREIHHYENERKRNEDFKTEREVFSEIMRNRDKYGIKQIKDSYKYLANTDIFEDIKSGVRREDILKKYHINNRTFNQFLRANGITYSKQKVVPNKPNKEELSALLETNSKAAVARMFGVSWNAVAKWCKKYEI